MSVRAALAGLLPLVADPPVDPSTGRGAEWGKAAPIGLLILLLLGLATFFLIKSMNKNLRKVPPSFGDPPGDSKPTPAARVEPAEAVQRDPSRRAVGDRVERVRRAERSERPEGADQPERADRAGES